MGRARVRVRVRVCVCVCVCVCACACACVVSPRFAGAWVHPLSHRGVDCLRLSDVVIRFAVVMVKAAMVAALWQTQNAKRAAQAMSVAEVAGLLLRDVFPLPVWFQYFYLHPGSPQKRGEGL